MKMIDLKLSKQKSEVTEAPKMAVDRDRWPYGLRLTFESEQVDKLPQLEKVKIGENVSIMAEGEVTSIRMNEEKEGKKKYSVEVQIQLIGVEGKSKSQESMIDAMKSHKKSMTMKMGS